MVLATVLRRVFSTGAPHKSVFEVLDDALVDLVAEVFDCARVTLEHHWRRVVWKLTLGFGVDPDQVKVLPDFLQKIVKVPFVVS